MNFLKTLFWVVLAVVAVIFSTRNWMPVTINLWGGLQVDVKLPLLMLASFLVGLLPPLILHYATRWRLQRRLSNTERALADVRAVDAAAPPLGVPLPPPPPPSTLL